MSRPNSAGGGTGDGAWILAAVLGVIGLAGGVWAAEALAARFDDAAAPEANPIAVTLGALNGKHPWPPAATKWAVAELAVVAAVTAVVLVVWARGGRRHGIDRKARQLTVDRRGIGRYLGGARGPGVYAGEGPPIGFLIRNGRPTKQMLRLGWEDVGVIIAGPRTGKTTSIAIPAICMAPAAVVATSNKVDLYDVTAAYRARHGRVWLFDPQHLAATTTPGFWWDPLSMARDVRGARQLAQIWADVGRQPGDRKDPYFDSTGAELLACLLLAAACDAARPGVAAVASWLKQPDDRAPEHALTAAGHASSAESLKALRELSAKQRDGVYGTARKMVAFLDDPQIVTWVSDPADGRERFDAEVFVASTDTLYLLAKEGEGSSAPLVTAFTKAVLDAAEGLARTQPGGRLALPLLAVLDEAANVCRIAELPALYSHYGSRGIIPLTFLQGWSQGAGVWGEQGMETLWSAANMRVYLGGVAETPFLRRLVELCGDWDAPTRTRSTSNGTGSSSTSTSYRREPVFSIDDLASLPPGRALVIPSATRAVLAATRPWANSPLAAAITTAAPPDTATPVPVGVRS